MARPKPHEPRPPIGTRKPLPFTTKTLTCASLILAFLTSAPAPAGADPDPSGGDSDIFGGLSCSCSETVPADSPDLERQIRRGIQHGLSVGRRR